MTAATWPEVLGALVARNDLTPDQASWAMGEILGGEATPSQIAGFAVALRTKGETLDELEGLVSRHVPARRAASPGGPLARRGRHRRRPVDVGQHLHDGRDRRRQPPERRSSSTATGPRPRRRARPTCSRCSAYGSTSLPTRSSTVGQEVGITFCFAPAFHPALRHAAVPRRELGIGTTFNFLGPLAHPGKPAAQAIGCADPRMAPLMAGVFARRGVDAWVFRGEDGLDELTTTTTSQVWAVAGGSVAEFAVDPAALGLTIGTPEGLRGGDVTHNARVVRDLVAGVKGPVRDAVVLNAGAALAVHAAEEGDVLDRLAAGMVRAQEAIDDGRAQTTLDRWVQVSAAA